MGKQLNSWWNVCIQKPSRMRQTEFTPEDRAMTRTLTKEQESKARQLADEIQALSAEVFQEVAEILTATPDEKIFGDTEFIVRSHILKLVAKSFTAHLAQKKTATSAPASIVQAANDPRSSKATAIEIR
jgi:hypothetical protein